LSNCFSVGDRVKWAPDIAVSVWRGTVTAIEGEKCICDDRGRISAGLLVMVEDGEMELSESTQEMLDVANAITARIAALEAERDALVDVIAMQAETLSEVTDRIVRETAFDDMDATLQRLLDYYLLEVCGTSDWRAGDTKLGALVNHIRRFYR
jgi:hypothetical protein